MTAEKLPLLPLLFALFALNPACNRQPEPPGEPAAAASDQGSRRVRVAESLLQDGRITLAQVERRNPADEIRATGVVEPDLEGAAEVGALVSSSVTRVLVREGDLVKRGQVLAELNAPDAARVAGELAKARSQRGRAERALQRERKLIAQRATTDAELERAQADLAGLRAEERAARTLLAAYGASGARIQVRAPIAGVVVHRGVDLGARVEGGARVFRIVDPQRLLVRAEVLERDAERVNKGDTAKLLFPNGKTCGAEVIARGSEVEPRRHSVSVRLAPVNCTISIAGQTLDVRLLLRSGAGPKQVALPRDAVVELDGTPVVFLEGNAPGEFELEPVIVDHFTETTAFLTKGPDEKRRVAVRGTILLKGEWMRSTME